MKKGPFCKPRNQNSSENQLHSYITLFLVYYEIKMQKLRQQMFVSIAQSCQMVLLI